MSIDPTEPQGGQERRQSREMSLKPGQPPTQVPGYDPERFLGVGAYGEVWVARERNTGRRVAIKFYAHRSGLDWSLLSREVEKLAFLFADRYVVQLLGVGWDAEPPYYIMEYLEHGSLADRLQQGPIPVDEAVGLFRDVAVGLVHAHGKGVLHCDLKPANILLDQDNKPRMADFGQSRLSTEQVPALGTLFYMAPEQADLEAVPDARWDVYALGALLYCMLTGGPPHRTGEAVKQFEETPHLMQRLKRYRRLIEGSPLPVAHRQVRGVDRALAEIIDRCLAVDPEQRFPNAQGVLDALADRAARRARRPMVILGAVLPALLLLVVTWAAWQGFSKAVGDSESVLTESALRSNQFAAEYVARTAGNELERRYRAVEQMAEQLASSQAFRRGLEGIRTDPAAQELLAQIDDLQKEIARSGSREDHPDLKVTPGVLQKRQAELKKLCGGFLEQKDRRPLQEEFQRLIRAIPEKMEPRDRVASWFFCDAEGFSLVRDPESDTIGRNFSWRSYFHGEKADWKEWRRPTEAELEAIEESWRPEEPGGPRPVRLSAIFPSQATGRWIVAVSTGVFGRPPAEHGGSPPKGRADEGEFLGVVALTVEVGKLVELKGGAGQFAVLVDYREGRKSKGVIVQHRLFNQLIEEEGSVPPRFQDLRVDEKLLPAKMPGRMPDYRDPAAKDPAAKDSQGNGYGGRWLAYVQPVEVPGEETGWLVIVQEDYDAAIGSTLDGLKAGLVRRGLIALVLIVLVMICLWWFATRLSVKH